MKGTYLLLSLLFLAAAAPAPAAEKHECSSCHTPSMHNGSAGAILKAPLMELCVECHADRKGVADHRIGIKPKMGAVGLPLDKEGMMTCITCHDPHGKAGLAKLLRVSSSDLCLKCH